MNRLSGSSRGSVMLIVLATSAVVSMLCLVLLQYSRWQAGLSRLALAETRIREARSFADHRVRRILSDTLPRRGTLHTPVRRSWSLPPGVRVVLRLKSLNGRINLNRLNDPGRMEPFQEVVRGVMAELGYPRRGVEELIHWMESEGTLSPNGRGRYGGYGYRPPGRDLLHLDEVALVSGFIQPGITEAFRRWFTVDGSGNLNPLHWTPERWRTLRRAAPASLPLPPGRVLRRPGALSRFLREDARAETLRRNLPFLTPRDDSFVAHLRFSSGDVVRRVRAVYRFDWSTREATRRAIQPVLVGGLHRKGSGEVYGAADRPISPHGHHEAASMVLCDRAARPRLRG